MPSMSRAIKERIAGALLIALGVFALTTPLIAGQWSLAILGLPLIAMGIAEAYAAFTSPRGNEAGAYLPGVLAFLAGNVLLLSSALVLRGLLIVLIAILTIDGFGKIIAAWRRSRPDRLPLVINGLVDFGRLAQGDIIKKGSGRLSWRPLSFQAWCSISAMHLADKATTQRLSAIEVTADKYERRP